MPLYQVIVLGVVQGLTEFLPISSTAHLYLVPWLSGWPEHELTFDVALHVGTLFAVLIFFFRTWVELLAAGFGVKLPLPNSSDRAAASAIQPEFHRHVVWFLVIGTIPGGVAGLLFQEQIETTLRSPYVMGIALIAVALLMSWAEKVSKTQKDLSQVGLVDSLWVGLSQAFALIPGVSRSGVTISAGLLLDFRREAAARFSFLLSTPIIAGAAVKTAIDLSRDGIAPGMITPFVVGIIVSAIAGYATISFFLKFLQFGTFKIFVYYRVVLGIIVLALAFFLGPDAF
jgi:undecaprenyl-diphosphatase